MAAGRETPALLTRMSTGPSCVPDLGEHGVDGGLVGQVDGPGPTSRRRLRLGPIEGGDLGPVLGQEGGGGPADAAGGAGHHGDAANDAPQPRGHTWTLCGSSAPS